MTSIISSREFNQHTHKAQREAEKAPVFITNRGKLAHVLLSYADYQKLVGQGSNTLEVLMNLNSPDVADIPLPLAPRRSAQRRPVNFEE
ncbi:PHD/YefM family antitoxin component YafN of YafNO toxin-antitoxin module [Neisseria sp. HSC-16F19]|nr:type II toxin-antitoxin system Phd/YefM family antitoxin [Neisseria sp. HSC-16F19]MCP2040870.1 PHD/YefM family antitoxin component YafN of YafNO toxin-antitoxin module [Neisseria sp. HSC-16F19]